MELSVTNNCIKCGICSQINGDIFELTNNGALVNNEKIKNKFNDCYDAIFFCPVGAIHFDNF